MTWPLEPEGALRFARGLQKVIVVEEKRALIETQLKEICYGQAGMPQIIGKRDEQGAATVPEQCRTRSQSHSGRHRTPDLEYSQDAHLAARVTEQNQLETRVPGPTGDGSHALLLLGLPAQHRTAVA
jgi:indolepyruvate ferredoxin oxidoreductase